MSLPAAAPYAEPDAGDDREQPPAGEYDCCRHCKAYWAGGRIVDPHAVDPAPHARPCAEGCNGDE